MSTNAAQSTASTPSQGRAFLRWRTPGPWIVFGLAVLLVLLIAAGAWIGTRALQARDALADAQTLVGELRTAGAEERESVTDLADRIADRTGTARSLTSDLVWRAGELIPLLGVNLTVVRELAQSTDEVARNAVVPLAPVLGALDPKALSPSGGGIDLAPLSAARGPVADAAVAVSRADERVAALPESGLVGPVAEAREQLGSLLGEAAGVLDTTRTITALAPSMLGADGPRNYVLIFQNNAEARALGGNPASLMQLSADDGTIRIVRQASSQDFPIRRPPIDVALPVGSVDYGPFTSYLMDATMRPDFPTAATVVKAYWEREFGDRIDGVMSFDPVALGYLLEATGPLTLADGTVITSEDAAGVLVHDVYYRYSDYREQNVFFESAAAVILNALTAGPLDLPVAGAALGRAADEGRWLLWSADADEQEVIGSTPLDGILPTDSDEMTSVGVFFADQSSSKMDYYLGTAVDVRADLCDAENATFDASVQLRSRITPGEAAQLPFYVGTRLWGGEKFLTDVYVFGPPGSTFASSDRRDLIVSQGTDLGRPVVRFQAFLTPGETVDLQASFIGSAPSWGPLDVITTPMFNPTTITTETAGC